MAQVLFDSAIDEFKKWSDVDYKTTMGFYDIEKIADRIIDIFSSIMKNGNGESENSGDEANSDEDGNDNNNSGNGKADNRKSTQKQGKQSKGDKSQNGENVSDNDNGNDDEDGENVSDNDNGNAEKQNGKDEDENGNADNDEKKNGMKNSNGSDDEETDGNADGDGENASADDASDSENSNDEAKDGANGEKSKDGNKNGDGDDNGNENDNRKSNDANKSDEVLQEAPHGGCSETEHSLDDELGNDENPFEKEIKEAFERIKEEAKSQFGDYVAYTDEDTIEEAKSDEYGYNNAKHTINSSLSSIASYLEQCLRSKSRVSRRSNLERGRIDTRTLYKLAKPLTQNVFEQNKQGLSLKSTVVSLLIDESGSIGTICYEFRKLAIALSEAFDKLGIRFEVLGHTNGYTQKKMTDDERKMFTRRNRIRMFEHKRFDETYRQARYKLGSINSLDCNVDGEALLMTGKRNFSQKASRHIIMVLSDGLPNDGYLCRQTELNNHLSSSIELLRKNGMEIYAFGIGTEMPKKYYGEDNFVYIKRGDNAMNTEFIKRLGKIIIDGGMGK